MRAFASATAAILLTAVGFLPIATAQVTSVTTYYYDGTRSGQNVNETTLSPANVTQSQFGKLFATTVDGYVYAQPLYVANVKNIAGGTHNVLYVATEHASIYAIDADSGAVLWQQSLINPPSVTTVTSGQVSCTDLVPEIGISSTPVIDTSTGTIYFVVKTNENGTYHQRLHALDIVTHTEKFGGPIEISATFSGRTFNALQQHNRPGLLLENGHVIIAWASHCDNTPYQGWLMSYNAATLAREAVFNTEPDPNGYDGGIWMSGDGVAVDASGYLYFATGNGDYNSATGDYGDSVMKLSGPSGGVFTIADWFTPINQSTLSVDDTDVGSGGLLLLPDLPTGSAHQQQLVQMGKEGKIYEIDRGTGNMGKLCATCTTSDTQIVQELPGASNGVWGSPAYWNNTVYWGSQADVVSAWSFNASNSGLLSASPISSTSKNFGYPAGSPTISANGASNGILWILDNSSFKSTCCQVLYAYNATNLGTMLYNSSQAQTPKNRDQLGGAVKFAAPMVANGKVYVGGQSAVYAFGLISTTPTAATPTFSPAPGSYSNSVTVTLSDSISGATIHCTTDGVTTPTASSPVCTTVTITASTTLQAIAVATGYNNSLVASGAYSIVSSSGGINYGAGFSSSGLTLNGSAKLSGTSVQLTDGNGGEAGSAFYNSLVSVANFTTDFSFQLTSPSGDGITFAIQGVGPTALGPSGGGLGYGSATVGGTGGISNSVAVKFDLYNNNGEGTDSTGLYTNGASPTTPAIDMTNSGVNLHSGDVFSVHITYNGTALTMTITDASNPSETFTTSWTVNIPSVVGSSSAYVGFTGATGSETAVQDILTWTYVASSNSQPGVATVSPTVIGFGRWLVGSTSTTKTVKLTNSSANNSLAISSIAVSGGFAQTNNCPAALQAASYCVINVSSELLRSGSMTGMLSIYSNAANSPQLVTLNSIGVLPVSVTPPNAFFGKTAVGTASAPVTATITNNTGAAVNLSFTTSADFTASAPSSGGCGSSLSANSSCQLSVVFQPSQNGQIGGSLAVSGASFATQIISLSGTGANGTAIPFTFQPTTLAFGNQAVGASSAPRTVTVTNKGSSSLTLKSLTASAGFAAAPAGGSPCQGALAPGAQCTFAVTFTPTTNGAIIGQVAIANSGAPSPVLYRVTGSGVWPVTFSANSLTFAAQTAGTTSAPQSVSLLNNQAVALSITSIVASGDFAALPGGSAPCGSSLAGHASCTFVVTFAPNKTGSIKGTVTVTHNASGSPQDLGVSGTGQ